MIETKFKRHHFAVHKALSLDDNNWVVSHVATSMVISHSASKEAAIAVAIHILDRMSIAEMDRAEEQTYLERARLLVKASEATPVPDEAPSQKHVAQEETADA